MQDKLYKILGRIITLPVVLVIFTGINIFIWSMTVTGNASDSLELFKNLILVENSYTLFIDFTLHALLISPLVIILQIVLYYISPRVIKDHKLSFNTTFYIKILLLSILSIIISDRLAYTSDMLFSPSDFDLLSIFDIKNIPFLNIFTCIFIFLNNIFIILCSLIRKYGPQSDIISRPSTRKKLIDKLIGIDKITVFILLLSLTALMTVTSLPINNYNMRYPLKCLSISNIREGTNGSIFSNGENIGPLTGELIVYPKKKDDRSEKQKDQAKFYSDHWNSKYVYIEKYLIGDVSDEKPLIIAYYPIKSDGQEQKIVIIQVRKSGIQGKIPFEKDYIGPNMIDQPVVVSVPNKYFQENKYGKGGICYMQRNVLEKY